MSDNPSPFDGEFLYAVLNLPTSASQQEIRERYRSLSIIFHPDKQQDESLKETASKRFLEIQKAYEVLSDRFLREVYDTLGGEGLTISWPQELRLSSQEEIKAFLKNARLDRRRQKLENAVRAKGQVICGVNALPLFQHLGPGETRWGRLLHRFGEVRLADFGIRHSIQKEISQKTQVTVGARISRGEGTRPGLGRNIFGTVRHQFSPRWAFEAAGAILQPSVLSLKSIYRDEENAITVQAYLSPGILRLNAPPISVSLSRRLFEKSATEGIILINTGQSPSISVNLVTPTSFDLTPERYSPPSDESDSGPSLKPDSESGFGVGARYSSYGFHFAGINSGLRMESGITFTELALQAKIGIELGIAGLAWLLTGSWANEESEISASVGLSQNGVLLRLDLSYIGQKVSVPIILSQDYDAALGLITTIVPSTIFVVGYHFILKPRRRARRAAHFKVLRHVLEEDRSVVRREIEETASLLKETAKKHMDIENSKAGLVILQALYGPIDTNDEARELAVDVTIPIQALVLNSQLYIPGNRSKAGIPGFYDPTPSTLKSLRVRYKFRERYHYAEISDFVPVVLPLEDHLE